LRLLGLDTPGSLPGKITSLQDIGTLGMTLQNFDKSRLLLGKVLKLRGLLKSEKLGDLPNNIQIVYLLTGKVLAKKQAKDQIFTLAKVYGPEYAESKCKLYDARRVVIEYLKEMGRYPTWFDRRPTCLELVEWLKGSKSHMTEEQAKDEIIKAYVSLTMWK
jgi:hypothetical protein